LTAPGPASSHFAILVAIESDATRYRGDHAQRPRLLDASGAQQVLAHLASDLHALFPRHQHFTLSMPGALFDQTQVLRPGWPLFEALDALAQASPAAGPSLLGIGARVRCQFETFDAFARRDPHTAEGLPERYAAWTREYRQYLLTLAAHGVPLVQHLPGIDTPLQGNVLLESLPWSPDPDACGVTEQGCAELGVIAVTVVDGEQLLNYYPLNPRGLDEMHRQIREAGHAARGFAYPGRLLFDPASRCLVPYQI